ncbi:hypothetical protein [Acanthopleuribacter pedis]|uniref:Uncharacterized protein n=1 Tax=Acanthopleuribacter pedis TaxID=442870 RepID=A0A8J7U4E6_9BACT|nr:hypothetical protein [Acanthopleuribacter pedis]MBO1320567.1 hypothetical protein [Acanthopleuribacter pedis]
MKKFLVVLLSLSLVSVAFAQAKEPAYMINVDLQNFGGEQGNMKMSLPLTFIESMRPQIEEILTEVHEGDHGVDIKALWASIRDAGPTEFVQVDGPEGKVSVKTDEEFLMVNVTNDEVQDLQVKIPLTLFEAIMTDVDKIDYEAIIETLKGMAGQDLVTIDSEEIVGRVWISK